MPTKFRLEQCASPIGGILIVTDAEDRVCAIEFADRAARMHQLLKIQRGAYTMDDRSGQGMTAAALAAYFAGDLDALSAVPVYIAGTPFQRQVWTALRAIPPGVTTSYGRLAADLGRPRASRAVGYANGSNSISLVVPCHRVIGADGSLTGYGGGMERKRWLLDHEQASRAAA